MPRTTTITWAQVATSVDVIAEQLGTIHGCPGIFPILRGGAVPATMLAARLGFPLLERPEPGCIIVDDLIDSGATSEPYRTADYWTVVLALKREVPGIDAFGWEADPDEWLVFPWEGAAEQAGPTDAVTRLLEFIGEDPTREGLTDTPTRVVKALGELTAGYHQDPAEILSTVFHEPGADEMVLVDGIAFTSLCEHHLLPFTGTAVVGYVPADGKVVGLSKIPRLVLAHAQRLQVQERMTAAIAADLEEHLAPQGVGVVIRAHHSCMGCRGVRQPGAAMTTSATLGLFRDDPRARAEFLALAVRS